MDVGYKVASFLEAHFGERMKVAGILKKVYEQKWFGKKTRKGFYLHKANEKEPNNEVYTLTLQRQNTSLSDEDILKRMLYRMVNEAAMCLEEKVCNELLDVDIGMIMGIGFPPFRGGLIRYADSVGWDKVIVDLEKFSNKFSPERFKPSAYLLGLVKKRH